MEHRRPTAVGHLSDHLLRFGLLLREMGIAVSPGQMLDVITALEHTGLLRRDDVRAALRCVLVLRREDLPLFESAFDFFWQLHNNDPEQQMLQLALPQLQIERRRLRLPRKPDPDEPENSEQQQEELELQLTFSRDEALRRKDFAQCSWEEVQACHALMRRMQWRIEPRRTRRRRPDRKGRRIDMRRTLRLGLRTGAEPLLLARRSPRVRQRPLVVICDISGSMERYSRVLLQFAHTLAGGMRTVESFVFGTRLTRITRQLQRRDIDDALALVSKHVIDWSGGTRIGDAVRSFNLRWSRRVLGRSPVVLLISDGWDRGDPETLSREMDRLQHSCHRLIWLNPLLGTPGYEPLTIGMQAALPYIDDFLPVHNLVSLEQLAERLSSLPDRRPARRRRPLNGGRV
jgi:uncharacterized protein with von Willebrand factor type A (vWA) domain